MSDWLKKRVLFIKLIFLAFLLLIVYTHLNYSSFKQKKLLEMGNKLAWREGVLYPPRGRIVDANNKSIAWSERYYDFVINKKYCEKKYLENINNALTDLRVDILPSIPQEKVTLQSLNDDIVIVYGIKPDVNLKQLMAQISDYKFFRVKPRLVRLVIDHKSIKKMIGKTAIKDGKMVGISGLELKFDKILSGEATHYKVMLNRSRKWITETFEAYQGVKSQDIVLKQTIAELLNYKNGENSK